MSSNLTCIWSTIVQASEMAPDQKQTENKKQNSNPKPNKYLPYE